MTESSSQSAPLSVADYQAGTLLTESQILSSPADQSSLQRWQAVWAAGWANLQRIRLVIGRVALDKTKKYAAYHKLPANMLVTYLDKIDVGGIFDPTEDFAPVAVNTGSFGGGADHLKRLQDDLVNPYRVLHAMLGITTELDELIESMVESTIRFARKSDENGQYVDSRRDEVTVDCFDRVNIGEELGDLMFYVCVLCNALGLSLQTILEANRDKLMLRYKKKLESASAESLNKEWGGLSGRVTPLPPVTFNMTTPGEDPSGRIASQFSTADVPQRATPASSSQITAQTRQVESELSQFSTEAAQHRDIEAEQKTLRKRLDPGQFGFGSEPNDK